MRLKTKIVIYTASLLLPFSSFAFLKIAFCPDAAWIKNPNNRNGRIILEQPGTGTGPMSVANPDHLDLARTWVEARVSNGRLICGYEGKNKFNIISESRGWEHYGINWRITPYLVICSGEEREPQRCRVKNIYDQID
ncbi:MAG: hypothetical protein H0T84_09445 [Tatlockia sp.]|nr:hypothetical protein [Tatlockia sp.]